MRRSSGLLLLSTILCAAPVQAQLSSLYNPPSVTVSSLTQLPSITTGTLLGNNSGSTSTPTALTGTQAKSLLSITNADVSGLGTASTASTGASGHTIPFLDGTNTFSGATTINNSLTVGGSQSLFVTSTATTTVYASRFQTGGTNSSWPGAADGYLGLYASSTDGAVLGGYGSVNDVSLYNKSGGRAFSILAGTTNVQVVGSLAVGGVTAFNTSGVLQAASFPALTGDVTTSAGSLATTLSSATVISKVSGQALAPSSVAATGLVTSSGATSGVGYATGAGGTVTQATSRTTGVTCSKVSCGITLFSTTTTAGQTTSMTVTDTAVAATDVVACSQQTGTGVYFLSTKVAAGSYVLSVYTPTAVGSGEAPVINCVVLKGVSS